MNYDRDLEEENIKLRETVVQLTSENEQYRIEIKSLEKENLKYHNVLQKHKWRLYPYE